ncbi:hypothetical protein [Paenibacillus marinisediminis]
MSNSKVAVITEESSDLLEHMLQLDPHLTIISRSQLLHTDLELFDAIAIIGGTSNQPILFSSQERICIEAQINKGKRVFAEYVASIGHVYFEPPVSTRFDRLVYCSDSNAIEGLSVGMLIDDQCGMRLKPHEIACVHTAPILQYTAINGHDQIVVQDEIYKSISDRALWFDQPDNLLICSFRMANFVKSRFSPNAGIKQVVSFIVSWLMDEKVEVDVTPAYTTGKWDDERQLQQQVQQSVHLAMEWFDRSGTLYDEGKTGVLEGFGTEIYPDGKQKVSTMRRVDCIGEVSMPYFLNYLWAEDNRGLTVSNQLQQCIFDSFFSREADELYGMVRWTEEAWGICYQDDVARAVMPQLLKCLYTGTDNHLDDITAALQFLVRTTGTDGTRVFRTDNINLTAEKLQKLRDEPGNLPSAHYNGYYYAALLLAYKLTGKEEFLTTAIKGLDAILSVYPETIREQSETQEYCRLILPLSWLFWVTDKPEHKQWLYRVTKDLQKFKHVSGAYIEWDEGYKAAMRQEKGQGESSLLVENGNPIVDLLYSNNWLPVAFIQAHFVTKDDYFWQLWEETAKFMITAQLYSDDPVLHGAWARGFDVRLGEVFGSPADQGWGPWAIESGWTVAEITSGLLMGLLKDKLIRFY